MKKIQSHYDEMADIYDRHYNEKQGKIYYSHISEQVLQNIPGDGLLLDIGCGTGLFMDRYTRSGGRAIGIDISMGMILRARSRCPDQDVTLGTAETLPFRENTFDAISSLLTFSYIQNPELMLAEAFRVLRPGGSISLCTLGKNLFTSVVPIIYRIGEKMRIRRVGMAHFGEHYYGEHDLIALFEEIGFVNLDVQRCSFAHVDLGPMVFEITKKVEPLIEEELPYLAYNICISGKKPKD